MAAMRLVGVSGSESDEDDYLQEVIDLQIGGQPVMFSRRTTYYLLHVVDYGFSSYFLSRSVGPGYPVTHSAQWLP